jgi:hypothetical protein
MVWTDFPKIRQFLPQFYLREIPTQAKSADNATSSRATAKPCTDFAAFNGAGARPVPESDRLR